MAKRMILAADTFPAAASSGITVNQVVVMDPTTHGNVKLPASTPEIGFVGVALDTVDTANNVAVQIAGVATCITDGSAAINPGDWVVMSGATAGDVKTHTVAVGDATEYVIVGRCVAPAQVAATAGLIVEVLLTPQLIVAA